MYPTGNCKSHPNDHCYSTSDGKSHWLLDRPKLMTWAGSIVNPCHFLFYHVLMCSEYRKLAKAHINFPQSFLAHSRITRQRPRQRLFRQRQLRLPQVPVQRPITSQHPLQTPFFLSSSHPIITPPSCIGPATILQHGLAIIPHHGPAYLHILIPATTLKPLTTATSLRCQLKGSVRISQPSTTSVQCMGWMMVLGIL